MKYSFLVLLVCFCSCLYAQNDTEKMKLAKQYFDNGDYAKAEVLYKELLEKHKEEESYTFNYNACLMAQKKYAESEKLLSKKAKKNIFYGLELGYTYHEWEKTSETEKTWTPILSATKSPTKDYFTTLSTFFHQKQLPQWEIKTYQQARKTLKDDYIFSPELIQLFGDNKDIKNAVAEFVRLLKRYPEELPIVQTKVTNIINTQEDFEQAEQGILQEITQNEQNSIMKELLIWLYLQHKDYDNALIQAKALDRLNKEHGNRLIDLAEVAEQNQNYNIATEAYDYVFSRYPNEANYEKASYGKAKMSELKALQKSVVDKTEIQQVIQNYEKHLSIFGNNPEAMYRKARLQTFYTYQLGEAQKTLAQMINLLMNDQTKADALLLKADILVIQGDFDAAGLIYNEVNKSFKGSVMGQLAKFKYAQLCYYKGEFETANSNLKILKQGTSNDIANDALKLSLFIQDNIAMDSLPTAIKLYSKAELLNYQNKKAAALQVLDSLILKYPDHALLDDCWMLKAKIYGESSQTEKALACYQTVVDKYGSDILGDDALYTCARIYDYNLSNKEKALSLYKDFLGKYPGSLYGTEVRKRIRQLRGETIN